MQNKTKKFRFPFINLEKSIERAQEAYEKERQAAVRRSVLVKHWGYGPKSSGGLRTLGALVAFNLLEKQDNDHLKLTKEAMRILKGQEAARNAAIRDCALAPKQFKRVWDLHGSELPSDDSLQSDLIVDHGVADSTARLFVKNYKETLRFAGLDQFLNDTGKIGDTDGDSDADDEPESESSSRGARSVRVGDLIQWVSQGVEQLVEPLPVSAIVDHEGEQFVQVEGYNGGLPMTEVHVVQDAPLGEGRTPPVPRAMPAAMRFQCHLNEGVSAETIFRGAATKQDVEAYIDLLKIQMRAFPDARPAESFSPRDSDAD